MEVNICIGSSCHVKGSHDIVEIFKDLVEKGNLEDKVNLSAAFCLGHCTDGVTIKVDDKLITGVTKENAGEIFDTYIRSAL